MSEYVWAHMIIGGKLKKACVPELLGLLEVELEYTSDREELAKHGIEALRDEISRCITFEGQASYGHYPDLEKFCHEHGLQYDIQYGSCSEFGDGIEQFRPGPCRHVNTPNFVIGGLTCLHDTPTTVDGRQVVAWLSVKRAIHDEMESCKPSLDGLVKRLMALVPDVPEVPAFEVVEDEA